MNIRTINDTFSVPQDGRLFNDGNQGPGHPELRLPDYQPILISFCSHLTLTDCHLAILATIYQARLIVFEIARKNTPFLKRSSRTIKLEGEPREFDTLLSSIQLRFDQALAIASIETISMSKSRLLDVLKNPLIAHKDFKDSSSTSPPDLQMLSQDLDV